MRILHIIPNVDAGGAESLLSRLLDDSAGRRQEVAVLSLQPPGPAGEELRAKGVRVFSLRLAGLSQAPLAILRLARIANAYAPDILHGWMHQGSLAASLARMTMARPVALVCDIRHGLHGHATAAAHSPRWTKLGAWASARADAVVFNSRTVARQHAQAGFRADRSQQIPDAIDTALYRPREGARDRLCAAFGIDPQAIVVGHIAQRHPRNDQTMLVEAVARARSIGQDLHLLMAGCGLETPDRELQELAARLLPAERLTFSGPRGDAPEWLPGLDMLAMSSAWGEDFPHAIGQALACGVPVVATNLGDGAEIVGPCGRIVPPQDPVGFAEALCGIAAMRPEQRRQMGEAGRQRMIERYSLDTVLDRYRELHMRLHSDSRFLGRPADRQEALAGGPQP